MPNGSVYHYFPSKEGVLAELVARGARRAARPPSREAATASDERFADAIEALPAVRARYGPQAVRAAVRISNAFLDWALETSDPRARATVVQEMKYAVIAYLAPQLEAARRRVRAAASKRRSPRRPA